MKLKSQAMIAAGLMAIVALSVAKRHAFSEDASVTTDKNTATRSSGKFDGSLRQGPRRLIPGDHGVGRMIPDLSVTDINGKSFQLSEFANRPALVIAFTNTSCPISKKYGPSLAAIERQFAAQNVAFIYVNPTASEKPGSIQAAIETQGFAGPYVRDPEGKIARAVGATHTTDVFVLDSHRTIIYRGAVDDQYGFEYSLDAPRHEYLKLGINAAINRKPLLVAATQAPAGLSVSGL